MTSTESERLWGLSGESVREFLSNEITQILGRVAIELNGGEYKTLITHILMPVCIKAAITATEAALSDVPAPAACTCAKLNGQGICNGCATMLRHQVQRQREMNAEMAAAPDAGMREAALHCDGECTYDRNELSCSKHGCIAVYASEHPDCKECQAKRAAIAGAAQPAPPKDAQQALNVTFDPVKSQLRSRQTVEDGFGNVWLKACPEPGCTGKMHVMRPGDATCDREHTHKALRAAAQPAPPKETK